MTRKSGDSRGSCALAADIADSEDAGVLDGEHVIKVTADDGSVRRQVERSPLRPRDLWRLAWQQAGLQLARLVFGLLAQQQLVAHRPTCLQAQFQLVHHDPGELPEHRRLLVGEFTRVPVYDAQRPEVVAVVSRQRRPGVEPKAEFPRDQRIGHRPRIGLRVLHDPGLIPEDRGRAGAPCSFCATLEAGAYRAGLLLIHAMRVFIAGASGVIGVRLIRLLVSDGHEVAGMTRSPEKAEMLRELGAEPVVCDVFDASALTEAVNRFRPEHVMHQLTDLPDEADRIAEFAPRNNRIRTEGTRNLLAAARQAGTNQFLAQSIAWTPPAAGEAVAEHERLVLEAGGVVVRYGMFYGPGTYSGSDRIPPPPRIHVDEAARRTVPLLEAASGVVVVADEPS